MLLVGDMEADPKNYSHLAVTAILLTDTWMRQNFVTLWNDDTSSDNNFI